MKTLLALGALILGLSTPTYAQVAADEGHRGSRMRDLEVLVEPTQAQDTVTVTASWVSRNNFAEIYRWRVDALGITSREADTTTVSFQVAQGASDLSAVFCVLAQRLSDGRRSTEVCSGFVVPAADVVLPPDSLNVQVSLNSVGSNWGTVKWDTVPGVTEYFAYLETTSGVVAQFPFASRSTTLTA